MNKAKKQAEENIIGTARGAGSKARLGLLNKKCKNDNSFLAFLSSFFSTTVNVPGNANGRRKRTLIVSEGEGDEECSEPEDPCPMCGPLILMTPLITILMNPPDGDIPRDAPQPGTPGGGDPPSANPGT